MKKFILLSVLVLCGLVGGLTSNSSLYVTKAEVVPVYKKAQLQEIEGNNVLVCRCTVLAHQCVCNVPPNPNVEDRRGDG